MDEKRTRGKSKSAKTPKEQPKKLPSGYGYIKDVVLPEGKIAIIKEWTDSSIKHRGK